MPNPRVGSGSAGSTRPQCRKRVRPAAVCDRIRWDGPQPAAESRGRKGCSFLGHLGGRRIESPTHTSIHPLVSCNSCSLGRGTLGDLCSCWHTDRWSLQRRIPSVVTIQLGPSSSSARTSLHNCGVCCVFLCFPFPLGEGSGTAQPHGRCTGVMGLRAGCTAHPSLQPCAHTLLTPAGVQVSLDRSPASPETTMSLVVFRAPPPAFSKEMIKGGRSREPAIEQDPGFFRAGFGGGRGGEKGAVLSRTSRCPHG